MHSEDSYKSIKTSSEGFYKDKGSKFYCELHPISNEIEAISILKKIKENHPSARHHCYAYRLGLDKSKYRINDDGEPSGTAGKPILGQLLSNEITNVIAITIRYSSGTKLGVPGLIQAYRESVQDAIKNSSIINKTISDYFEVNSNYENLPFVNSLIKKTDCELVKQTFEDGVSTIICVRKSLVEKIIPSFKANHLIKISFLYTI